MVRYTMVNRFVDGFEMLIVLLLQAEHWAYKHEGFLTK